MEEDNSQTESIKADYKQKQILKYYSDLFERIGKFPGPPYCIQLDQGVPPKQTPCCPIP